MESRTEITPPPAELVCRVCDPEHGIPRTTGDAPSAGFCVRCWSPVDVGVWP